MKIKKTMQKLKMQYGEIIIIVIAAICSAYTFTADFFTKQFQDGIPIGLENSYIYKFFSYFSSTIDGNEITFSVLTISLFFLYYVLWNYCSFSNNKFVVVSGILSILTVLYYPYTYGDSLTLLWDTEFQIVQTILFFVGYFCFFHIWINVIFEYMKKPIDRTSCKNISFVKISVKLAIVWLPNVIVKFPGAFCPDSRWQLEQGLGLTAFTSHHPPFYTFLLGRCALLGNSVFGSYNIGVFIFIFIQYLIMVVIFGYSLYYLKRKGVSHRVECLIWFIYCICPFIISSIGIVLKDVIYSAFCLAFIVFCTMYIDNGKRFDFFNVVWMIISAIFTVLTRNNGKEVVYPVLCIIAIVTIHKHRKNTKQIVMTCAVVILPVILSLGISKSLEVHYEIEKGSIAEALSFPFQQTARTVLEHSNELPAEEKEIIDSTLKYDTLAERYQPDISDPVKAGYKGWEADLRAYAKVWVKQFVRYPMTYCEATLSQSFPIFCILNNGQRYYHSSNVTYEDWEIVSEYAFLDRIDGIFEIIYKTLNQLPIINFLSNTSFWCVMLIVLSAFVWKNREYDYWIILCPLWLSILCIILGPAAGSRYAYPIAYSMPFVLGSYITKQQAEDKNC